MAKAQILDRPAESVTLFTDAGADWISVLAGSGAETIHTATTTARDKGVKIMLDLADASSIGQNGLRSTTARRSKHSEFSNLALKILVLLLPITGI